MTKTRKIITAVSFMLILLIASAEAQTHRFQLALDLSYLAHRDSNYKDIYGSGSIFPELKAGLRIFSGLQVTGGFGYFKEKGTIHDLEAEAAEAESLQTYYSAGLEYLFDVSWSWAFKVSGEYIWIDLEESAFAEKIEAKSNAFRVGAGLIYDIGHGFFIEFFGAYTSGNDTVNEIDIKLGGFQVGIGLGFRL
ncbi:MAG: outer membrane beta-barrel protein [Candidatus Aminicenantaceae bacterium]